METQNGQQRPTLPSCLRVQSRTVSDLSVHVPFRLIMVGKTGDSESTMLARMLLDKHFYRDDFQPENIFTFVGSLKGTQN